MQMTHKYRCDDEFKYIKYEWHDICMREWTMTREIETKILRVKALLGIPAHVTLLVTIESKTHVMDKNVSYKTIPAVYTCLFTVR